MPGGDISSPQIRRRDYPALLKEVDEQFRGIYDGEPLQSRTMLIAATTAFDTCRSMDAAYRDRNIRYHVACAWRKAFGDLDLKSTGRVCLLANIWSSTSAVLRNEGPTPRGTNQFYHHTTVVDPKAIEMGQEDLNRETGGDDGRPGPGAGHPAGSEVKPMVDVIEGDMLNAAWSIATRGVNVLVLCMSNSYALGTGANGGCDYQEAEMFRRTNLSLHGKNHATWPMERRECAGVLAYDVSILRLGRDYGYMFLPGNARPRVDVLSTAVPNMSQGDIASAVKLTKSRIESLVKIGAQYEVCILSALGCGSYGHKAEDVAKIFRKAIEEY